MLKQTLLTCCLALVIMIGYGQKSKTKTPVSWESVVVQEKMKVGELMKKNHLPVVSEVMRHNMPAQQIHILVNSVSRSLSPWYELAETDAGKLYTPEWIFSRKDLKRFKE